MNSEYQTPHPDPHITYSVDKQILHAKYGRTWRLKLDTNFTNLSGGHKHICLQILAVLQHRSFEKVLTINYHIEIVHIVGKHWTVQIAIASLSGGNSNVH